MVRIPYIKIPSVRVGGIDPTSDIGTAIGGVQPTPITYLTQWKIVGNSEVHGNEIWSCGEYNPTDGKYHILVQPLGGSVADIALDEPLRKVNDVVDTIEFPSDTEDKALVTRPFGSVDMGDMDWSNFVFNNVNMKVSFSLNSKTKKGDNNVPFNGLCPLYTSIRRNAQADNPPTDKTMFVTTTGNIIIYDSDYDTTSSLNEFLTHVDGVELIYELATPTTELVDAPQIAEAESYSMVISQGGKAVEWSSFSTDSSE